MRIAVALLLLIALVAYGTELEGSFKSGQRHRPRPDALVSLGSQAAAYTHAAIDWPSHDLVFDSRVRRMTAAWVFSGYETEGMREGQSPVTMRLDSDVPVARARGAFIDVGFNGCRAAHWTAPFRSPQPIAAPPCHAWPYAFWRVAIRARGVTWHVHDVRIDSPGAVRSFVHRERAERLGSEIRQTDGSVEPGTNNTAILDGVVAGKSAAGTWFLPQYEFSHLGESSVRCRLDLYVIGALTGAWKGGSAQAWFDGKTVSTLAISHAPNITAPVFFTPLYQPAGVEFPVADPAACRSTTWKIQLRVKNALWTVQRVGVVLHYDPPVRLVANSLPLTVALAALVVLAMLIAAAALTRAVFAGYGWTAACAVVVILALALITHDQWDFPVWVRFANLVSFGSGNPAFMWAGTPLWPMLVSVVTPVQMAVYALTGNSGSEIPASALKLLIGEAGCCTAYLLSRATVRTEQRVLLFWATLLSPMALYEMAAGYREVVAALLAVIGMGLAIRNRLTFSAIVLVAAGSISESLLPLILLPPALRLAQDCRQRINVIQALGLLALGVGCVLVQWLALPPRFAQTALAFRVHSYRYGEGSWLGLLTAYNIVPQWVGALWSTWITFVVFGAISAAFAVKYVRILADRTYRRQSGRCRCSPALPASFSHSSSVTAAPTFRRGGPSSP